MVVRIPDEILKDKVSSLVEAFHSRRLEKLDQLKLPTILKKKNPYMYRAIVGEDPQALAEMMLEAAITSSDETSWGNDFFEELAIFVAEEAHADEPDVNAYKSDSPGTDLVIHKGKDERIYVAVKSGKHVFNSSSKQKQADHFAQLRQRLARLKIRCVVGYAYTSMRPIAEGSFGSLQAHNHFEQFAGREFWKFVSGGEMEGDDTLYLRIMQAMSASDDELQDFRLGLEEVKLRWAKEILEKFGDGEGGVSWEKILYFNAAHDSPRYGDFDFVDFSTVWEEG